MRSSLAPLSWPTLILVRCLAFRWTCTFLCKLGFDAATHPIAVDNFIVRPTLATTAHAEYRPIIFQERIRPHDMEILFAAINNVASARALPTCYATTRPNMISIKPRLWQYTANGRYELKALFWCGWLGLVEDANGMVLHSVGLNEWHGQTSVS